MAWHSRSSGAQKPRLIISSSIMNNIAKKNKKAQFKKSTIPLPKQLQIRYETYHSERNDVNGLLIMTVNWNLPLPYNHCLHETKFLV